MTESDPIRTVEGTSWPMVLFVELGTPRGREWARLLEESSVIVLAEGSALRAAFVVTSEKPLVVVLPASLPAERTQVVRDAARDVVAEVVSLDPALDAAGAKRRVEEAIADARRRRAALASAPRR